MIIEILQLIDADKCSSEYYIYCLYFLLVDVRAEFYKL